MDEVADAFNKVIELLDDSPATRDDIRAAAINIKTEVFVVDFLSWSVLLHAETNLEFN